MYNEEDFEGEEDQIINEEYKLWKYNSRYLYDTLLIGALEWPSLTVSFLPTITEDSNLKTYKIILGTHTTQNEQNYLLICKITLPKQKITKINDDIIENSYSEESINLFSKIKNKIEIEYKINHQNEVNKARPMPQENLSNIIATKCPNGEIHIFDYLKHPKNPIDMQVKPEKKLLGHTKEGFGLNWSQLKEGYLLSGSDDHRICLWDINSNDKNNLLRTFEGHKGIVEDVNFNKILENIFVSCGDDKKLILWDLRQENPSFCIEAHVQEVNCVDFNPFCEYLLLTSSNDKTCALWDIRNLKYKLHSFKHHKNDVIGVKWNPNIMSLFASFSSDRRVNIWDLSNIDKNNLSNDDDGPSELLFTHGGHTSNISDFDWNGNEELLCVSTSDDNIVQVWEMANYLYFKDSEFNDKDMDI
jgi:WD40 repeat protein